MHINDKSEKSDNTDADYKNQNNNKNKIRVCKEEKIVIINYEKSIFYDSYNIMMVKIIIIISKKKVKIQEFKL